MTLYICGDTGWRTEPRWAPQDVLDSEQTEMHHLSNPSPKRTVSAWYKGDGEDYCSGLGQGPATVGDATGLVLSCTAQRFQNVGDDQWWRITVELQKEAS